MTTTTEQAPGALMASETSEQPAVWQSPISASTGDSDSSPRPRPDPQVQAAIRPLRRARDQRPRGALREVRRGDRARLPCRAGLPVDYDRVRRTSRPLRRPDDRGQPVRRVAGPGPVPEVAARAGCPHHRRHQQRRTRRSRPRPRPTSTSKPARSWPSRPQSRTRRNCWRCTCCATGNDGAGRPRVWR